MHSLLIQSLLVWGFLANDISRRFVASLIFILITIFKLRELIIDAIPADLKFAISGGIGLFIAFLGLSQGELWLMMRHSLA